MSDNLAFDITARKNFAGFLFSAFCLLCLSPKLVMADNLDQEGLAQSSATKFQLKKVKTSVQKPTPEKRKKMIRISAVGDIMIGEGNSANSLSSEKIFGPTQDLMKSADIRFGNLEGPIYDGRQQDDGKAVGLNRFAFKTPEARADSILKAGFNVLSLANNHSKDFGKAGLLSTKLFLQKNGIQYSSKDQEIAEFNIADQKVALIAVDFYKGNRSLQNPAPTYQEISELKNKGYLVIVSAHCGAEGAGAERTPKGPEYFLGENRGDAITFAQKSIDHGADLILMHGPHVPRGMEVYHDRLIAYSLGNFLTEKGININGNAGLAPLLLVDLDLSGRFVRGKIYSLQQTRTQGVVYDPSAQALRLVNRMSELDFPNTMPRFNANGEISPRDGLRLDSQDGGQF